MLNKSQKQGERKPPSAVGVVLAFALTLVLFGGAMYMWYIGLTKTQSQPQPPTKTVDVPALDAEYGEIEQFKSEEDFNSWLADADAKSQNAGGFNSFTARGFMAEEMAMDSAVAPTAAPDGMGLGSGAGAKADRVSDTNVQVTGIDEPDILKTDGDEIYFSPQSRYYPVFRGAPEPVSDVEIEFGTSERMIAPNYREPSIKAINAFPPEDLAVDAEIGQTGDMLLHEGTLAIFTYEGVSAYDVSDPAEPKESWEISYENNNWPVAQRLMGGELYLITAGGINRGQPCPFIPLAVDGQDVAVRCGEIWHPVYPVPSELTYTVLKVDMATGETSDTTSFVGSHSSTVYMSADNIYVTHQYPPDVFKFISGFMNENSDLMPRYVLERLNRVAGYDISDNSKMNELRDVMGKWMQSLDEDEALLLANEMENRMGDYYAEHRREIQSTGIVRITADDLSVAATGVVPGAPLNQFSMDQYDGHLRVATTTGDMGGWLWQFGFGGQMDSVNDVYVLDMNMVEVGAALGMGLDERIYSVRFIGDEGYVVTFRQIDPFYVLDLSDPRQPKIAGELKIPGYSSYLHQVRDDLILGIGKEDNQVKLSLFDVSDPTGPIEASKYTLKEYWSDILDTHHAFLLDDKFEVFFLPGSNGGYIFSYVDDELELVKAVSNLSARRAVFLDDYLYVVGDEGVVVLNETEWEREAELEFE